MNMTIKQFCDKHWACKEGMNWATENCKDMDEVWEKTKPEWLIWVATRKGVLTDKELCLFAVWCARQVQHLMTDDRSIAAIDVAERHANGDATDEELNAARDAARVVAWAANNTSEAAEAAMAAYRVAIYATWGVAVAASYAASYVASEVADEVARVTAMEAQAEYLRKNCKPNFNL